MKTSRSYSLLALVAIQFSTHGTFAQQHPDSIAVPKNEIGISIVPYILLTNSDIDGENPLAHVFYKRQLSNHLYGRLALVLNNGASNGKFQNYASIKTQSNTNAYLESRYYTGSNYLQYMAGFEGRWGRKNVMQFTGVDLGYAYYKSEAETRTHTIVSPSGIVADSTVAQYRYTNQSVAVNPFYGLTLGISKHFFITAQVGLNLQLNVGDAKKVIDTRATSYEGGKSFNFDLHFGGVANHIAVCYRF